jgi:ABC transporter substrate binding protein
VTFDYAWADNQFDRLPELAIELVKRKPALIWASGGQLPPLAAKAATSTIPIVFASGFDPVSAGLVASLSRPGGNVTGVSMFGGALVSKRMEVLRELVPHATAIGVLVNPDGPTGEAQTRDALQAADTLGARAVIFQRLLQVILTEFLPTSHVIRLGPCLSARTRCLLRNVVLLSSWRGATRCPPSMNIASLPRREV